MATDLSLKDLAIIAASLSLLATIQLKHRIGINLPPLYVHAKFQLQICTLSAIHPHSHPISSVWQQSHSRAEEQHRHNTSTNILPTNPANFSVITFGCFLLYLLPFFQLLCVRKWDAIDSLQSLSFCLPFPVSGRVLVTTVNTQHYRTLHTTTSQPLYHHDIFIYFLLLLIYIYPHG